MQLLKTLDKDLSRYIKKGSLLSTLKIIVFSHAFHLVAIIRIGQYVRKIKFAGPFLSALVEYWIRIVFSSDISCKAKIGDGLMIIHGHDIVIGGNVVMGENCKIFNGITLGNKNTEVSENQQPFLGNSVVISTGAKILGGVRIGSQSIVGANSVVIKDVPPNSVAIGIPARHIKRNAAERTG